jgi:hypothetical protein
MSWKGVEDDQGRTYYYNETTGETQWTMPRGFEATLVWGRLRDFAKKDAGFAEATFKELDADGSGTIDKDEFRSILDRIGAADASEEVVASIMAAADDDGDGTVGHLPYCFIFLVW